MVRMLLLLGAFAMIALVPAPEPVAAATSANVTVVDFLFQPFTTIVDYNPNVANTITFTYVANGFSIHQPHSDLHNGANQGACFSGAVIAPGQATTVTITLSPACLQSALQSQGTTAVTPEGPSIRYHCHIHAGMDGRIILNLV